MKKLSVVLIALFIFFINLHIVQAVCTAEELNKLNSQAVNVTVGLDTVEREKEIDDEYNFPDGLTDEEIANYVPKETIFQIFISNLTENLYVTVKDSLSEETKTYRYEDSKDGVITIEQKQKASINNYTITVYSSDKTNCPDTKLYTLYKTVPLYNFYSEEAICDGIEDFYLCHEYLSIPLVSYSDFEKLAQEYKEGKINDNGEEIKPDQNKEEEKKGFGQFIKDNRNIIIVVSIIIAAVGGLVTVIIVKKQRSRIV